MLKIGFQIKSTYLKAQIQVSILGFRIRYGYFQSKMSKPLDLYSNEPLYAKAKD